MNQAAPFAHIFADGSPSHAMRGDRFIYDQRSGTLHIHRDDADIHFPSPAGSLTTRCFVGRDWTQELTRASAELYARLGGLRGLVRAVEGSFPTLVTFEIVG